MNTFAPSWPSAESMDRIDPLWRFPSEFPLSSSCMYLDGNSLGLRFHPAEETLQSILDSLRQYGVNGSSQGPHAWCGLSQKLGAAIAPRVGTESDQVIPTVTFHQLLSTLYHPAPERYKVLAGPMPSPLRLHGYNTEHALVHMPSRAGMTFDKDDITRVLVEHAALVVLALILYVRGQWLHMPRLITAARDRDIIMGFDLPHSVGVIPHHLTDCGLVFDFWCTGKYLKNSPASIGRQDVARRHFSQCPGLAGWFRSVHNVQLDLSHTLAPAPGARAYPISTSHVLSMAPLLGTLSKSSKTGIDAIRQKSLHIIRCLMNWVSLRLTDQGFSLATPADSAAPGDHISLAHPEAVGICRALKARHDIPDYRPPQVIRLAPAPFYTRYGDWWNGVDQLRLKMKKRAYEPFPQTREVIA